MNSLFDIQSFEETVFSDQSFSFNEKALELFHYQSQNNDVYKEFLHFMNIQANTVVDSNQIPFLPIQFFKTKEIKTGNWKEKRIFSSSGTTGTQTSNHHVKDILVYEKSFLKCFTHFFGKPDDYVFLAFLPSYLEREGSSLVYMADYLIKRSRHQESGFFLHNPNDLKRILETLETKKQKTILLGVTYALLDFAETNNISLEHTIIMETGGMKGRREEITRVELHQKLKSGFGVKEIYSEYGMTELFSQAYSKGAGKFQSPPWMKIIITSLNDPKEICQPNETGRINIIDLANIHTCAFIATEDIGKINLDGSFEILGRIDNSDIRGCSLLTAN